jgi:hypothetical protein
MLAALRVPVGLVLAAAALFVPSAAHAATHSPQLPSNWQHRFHVRSAAADPDKDGLSNWDEWRSHTNPKRVDTDRDGVDDNAEDYDRDGLDNGTEQDAGTDPGRRDSDGDGRPDGREDADRDSLTNAAEQAVGDDPTDPDTDGDGIRDGQENAGRVLSWDPDSGELTIRLASTGKTLTGQVDDATDVTCDSTDNFLTDDESSSDDSADDPSDDSSDDSSDDDTATAASIRTDASDDGSADDPSDDSSDDSGDDSATFDEACFDDILAPGAWVHEAEFTADADGVVFDSVALVDDSVED